MTAPPVDADVGGRPVRLSNLDKVFWPSTGTTKGDLLDYYLRVAGALLPHLVGRPLTLHRFPEGVEGAHWYETRCPPHPRWVRTQHMTTFRSAKPVHAAVIDDLASLLWAVNAGSVELHPFLVRAERLEEPLALVVDLDPGPPATLVHAARVALEVRDRLAALGLASWPKTSGGKGLHVVVPVHGPHTFAQTKSRARSLAAGLAADHPGRVVDVMSRGRRAGRVFVDWGQNDPGKSTVAPYSVRGLWYPTVSTPVGWEEVEAAVAADDPGLLTFFPADVLERVERHGDLFAPVLAVRQALP